MFSNFDAILSGNPVVKLEMSNAGAQYIQLYPFSTKNRKFRYINISFNITGEPESLQYLHSHGYYNIWKFPYIKVVILINNNF